MTALVYTTPVNAVCPCCGQTNIHALDIQDRFYAERNKVPDKEKDVISEGDGIFEINACGSCGFKWINNNGIVASSQLCNALIEFYTEIIVDADPNAFYDIVNELNSYMKLKREDLFPEHAVIPMKKLMFIRELHNFLNRCPMNILVDLYNDIGLPAAEDYVEDVFDVRLQTREEAAAGEDSIPKQVCVAGVLADD